VEAHGLALLRVSESRIGVNPGFSLIPFLEEVRSSFAEGEFEIEDMALCACCFQVDLFLKDTMPASFSFMFFRAH